MTCRDGWLVTFRDEIPACPIDEIPVCPVAKIPACPVVGIPACPVDEILGWPVTFRDEVPEVELLFKHAVFGKLPCVLLEDKRFSSERHKGSSPTKNSAK